MNILTTVTSVVIFFVIVLSFLIFESQTYDTERGSRRRRDICHDQCNVESINNNFEEVANYAHSAHDCKIIIRFETQLHCFSHCLTDVAVNFRLFTCTNRTRQMY